MKNQAVYQVISERIARSGKHYRKRNGFFMLHPLFLVATVAFLFSACINEDLSDCKPKQQEISLTYQIDLEHDISEGFDDEINSLHLGFWNAPDVLYSEPLFNGEEVPLNHTLKVTLPLDTYWHIATANCGREGKHFAYPQEIESFNIVQPTVREDTVKAMSQALYLGKQRMEIEREDRDFVVTLHPVVGKVVLHVQHAPTLQHIRCYLTNGTQAYYAWTDSWTTNANQVVDVQPFEKTVTADSKDYVFFTMPTLAESVLSRADDTCWKLYFYSELNGKTIQHLFRVKQHIEAGRVFEGSFRISEQGGEAIDVVAGVEIDTNWTPGHGFDQDL